MRAAAAPRRRNPGGVRDVLGVMTRLLAGSIAAPGVGHTGTGIVVAWAAEGGGVAVSVRGL